MFKVFSQYFPAKALFLAITETVLVSGSVLAAVYLHYPDPFLADEVIFDRFFPARVGFIVLLVQLCSYYNDLYDLTTVCRRSELAIRLIQSVGMWCLLLTAVYFLHPAVLFNQSVLVSATILVLIAIPLWREGITRLGFLFQSKERVLILGTGQIGIDLCRKLLTRNDLNFEIVGFLGEKPEQIGERLVNPSVIGTIDNLPAIVAEEGITRVVVSLPDRRGRLPVRDLLKLRLKGVLVEDGHTLYEKVAGKISLDSVNPSWLIFSDGFRKFRGHELAKRAFDLLFASIGIVLSFPIMLVAAIWIKIDSKGPILFRQERVGQFGRVFTLFKFRSMRVQAEQDGVPAWAQQDDSRITQAGAVLRRYRIDELPQFFNILIGDMSFVGPRPERPFFVEKLEKTLKYYPERHVVKPGLTGWAQIKFPYASSEEETREKLEYDFFYIKNSSLLFDLAIIFQTVKTVLFARGAR
jgi:sugar transferase (PEP-CTERM system associated)